MSYEQYVEYQQEEELTPLPAEDFKAFYDQIDVFEILPQDNIFIDPRQLQEVKAACSTDQGLYARMVLGQWVWGGGDKSRHFRATFKEHIHVVGHAESAHEDDWEVIVPHSNSYDLITGLDIGETNHAGAIIDSEIIPVTANGKVVERKCFSIVGELVSIGKEVSVEDFTYAFMEEIDVIEKMMDKKYLLSERCYSDQSSIEKYSAAGDTYQYLLVQAASEQRLILQGVQKAPGSVRVRVQLLKMLLVTKRFKVSAHCKHTIKMLKDLRKGTGRLDFIPEGDDNKHIFDAITYALLMECYDELATLPDRTGRRSGFVAVHV